jgi:hypothetical protein
LGLRGLSVLPRSLGGGVHDRGGVHCRGLIVNQGAPDESQEALWSPFGATWPRLGPRDSTWSPGGSVELVWGLPARFGLRGPQIRGGLRAQVQEQALTLLELVELEKYADMCAVAMNACGVSLA